MKLARRQFLAGATGALVCAATTGALSQQPGQVTLVVPFPPGGSTDALARLAQAGLQRELAATVIIENKAGAVGSLGAAQVARSRPDGSVFLVTFDSHAVIPALIEKPPLDIKSDLEPVMLVGTAPYVIAVNAARPFKTFGDVIAAAREKPGKLTYASVGIGTIGHLAMTMLAKTAGVEILHVPYKGGGPAINDVIGGHVDMIAGSIALVMPQLAGNNLRPLMQLGLKRQGALADVPTADESGFRDFEAVAWWGVFAPKGTPPALIEKASSAFKAALSEEEPSRILRDSQQVTLLLEGPEGLRTFFARQVDIWGKVVRDNGITASN
jgi:tripartite-type tricarboxylate transporter receptor subunit TctC